MKRELESLRAVISSCYEADYKICEETVMIDEESTRGFETENHIILMYSRANERDFTDCIEVLEKNAQGENPVKKLSEGSMLESYSKVVTECLKYDIDIAGNLKGIDQGTVKGFESKSYIVVTYKRMEGNNSVDYINFLKKSSEDKSGNISEGRRVGSSKALVELCWKYGIDITKGRLFLEAYSTRGVDFGDYIIFRYREVTKDDYISSAAVGLIDKKEGRIYPLRESALMLDDKITAMWDGFNNMTELLGWEADVLKGYKDVEVSEGKVTIKGNGSLVLEKR